MNEEEKKAIEELEEFIKGPCETCKYCEAAYKLNRKNIIQLLNLTKKLQKENDELKIIKSAIQTLQINSLEEEKYIVISNGSFLDGSYKHLLDDYIPIQKVKDKIEEEKLPLVIVGGRRNKRTLEYGIKLGRRQALQELLGSEK